MRRLVSVSSCLALWVAARVAQALTLDDFDQVSLIQLGASPQADSEEEESAAVYEAIADALSDNYNLSHSKHIWKFVSHQPYAPRLRGTGCLYLPTDDAWRSFYEWVEHPYPPLFAELIKNAYDPQCGKGQFTACPAGHVEGSHWSLMEERPAGSRPVEAGSGRRMPKKLGPGIGCVGARYSATSKNIQIFETEGHVGLPGKWMQHVSVSKEEQERGHLRRAQRNERRRAAADACQDSDKLPAIAANQKLMVPTRFIICCVDNEKCPVNEAMIRDQVEWMTVGYSGKEPWTEVWFDRGTPPPQVNMQLEFDLKEVKFVQDPECAQHAFSNTSLAARHNLDGEGMLTYVIMTDDQSGVLGMAEFPNDWEEKSPQLMVMIDSRGLRHWATKMGEADETYNEGDTCIHEGGHSLGLYHTFEGGCAEDGDKVSDTMPEQLPKYTCDDERSCQSSDPVHNFMDYTPDSCMSGFTELQKRRLWCMVKHYRPKLYAHALRATPPARKW